MSISSALTSGNLYLSASAALSAFIFRFFAGSPVSLLTDETADESLLTNILASGESLISLRGD